MAKLEKSGAERINIEDFEMQHVSPDRGGSLSIVIAGESEAHLLGLFNWGANRDLTKNPYATRPDGSAVEQAIAEARQVLVVLSPNTVNSP